MGMALVVGGSGLGCFGATDEAQDDIGQDSPEQDDAGQEGGEADGSAVESPHSGAEVSLYPLSECASEHDDTTIADAVRLTFDFEFSAHEMVVCGGLVSSIAFALVEGVTELVENPSASTLPEDYTYDGEGTYFIAPSIFDDLRMEVRFFLGRDYEFGATGELVTENLFVAESYLLDPEATISIDKSTFPPEVRVEVSHGGPGPLVELLGLGTDPPNPVIVTNSTLSAMSAHLQSMDIDSLILFTHQAGVSTIAYDVQGAPMLVESLLTGGPLDLMMVSADGFRADLQQDMDIDTWTVEYRDGLGALDGDIVFTTRGGPFDYVSRLHYDGKGWPEISLSCAP